MRTDRFASFAAAMVVGGGTWLVASGADAQLPNGTELNGILPNGTEVNGTAMSGIVGFDFNNVSAQGVGWTTPCPLPLDRR